MSKKQQVGIHSLPEALPPTVLTLFGATGDLALLYLLPTLVHMDSQGLLPETFRLVCVGRRDFTNQTFLEFLLQSKQSGTALDRKSVLRFGKKIIYYRGDFNDPKSFNGLSEVIADKELPRGKHLCYNRLYYFATAPEFFAPIASILKSAGLLMGCTSHERTIRVLVEKPFGHDLPSSHALNKTLFRFFTEQQIYRIDHYLAKETVQNLLVIRFANDFFEPIWNRFFVDHIEVSVLEELGVGTRGPTYDKTGALKDVVQNHVLQMLALVCMDQPKSMDTKSIQDEKVKVLRSLVPFTAKSLRGNVVRGQYDSYSREVGIDSKTETYFACKAEMRHPRWKGVPVYLRTGKRMAKKLTEISIHLKKQQHGLFEDGKRPSNVITFRIQPDEGVAVQVNNKTPGFGMNLHGGRLDFGYKSHFMSELPPAYERLLLDFIQGDQRLFISSSEIEASWKFVDSITKNWNNKNTKLEPYKAGSNGPKQAEDLMADTSRQWWTK